MKYPRMRLGSMLMLAFAMRVAGAQEVHTDFDQGTDFSLYKTYAWAKGTPAPNPLMDQRIVGYYNAQCCGVVVEYQQYNYPQYSTYAVPQDHRFNIGFTLAGLGTFSNFLGAFGGNTG